MTTFELEDTLPNCVLSHIDIQAEVEEIQTGTTGVWFQKGKVDHNITRVVSGISDTALDPVHAARETVRIFDGLYTMPS